MNMHVALKTLSGMSKNSINVLVITVKKLLERVEYLENVLKKHNLSLD